MLSDNGNGSNIRGENMKKSLLLTSGLLIVHGVVMACLDQTISPTGSAATDTTNFQAAVYAAEGGCTVFLTGGTFVLNKTINFNLGFVTITPDPPDRGDVTIQAGVNDRTNPNRYVFLTGLNGNIAPIRRI